MTLTLSACTATTLFNSNRGSVRRVSGFVLVGNSEVIAISVRFIAGFEN